jgi:hypothetical protein
MDMWQLGFIMPGPSFWHCAYAREKGHSWSTHIEVQVYSFSFAKFSKAPLASYDMTRSTRIR